MTSSDSGGPGRLRRGAEAGRDAGLALAETAVPGWLIEVVKPAREPVPWAQMLRAMLAISVPLAAGLALGQRAPGLLVATGGLLASVVDRGGPYALRLRRIAAAGLLGGAPGLVIGALIYQRGWISVVALMLVAGISALLSAVSDIASLVGLQLLVYASFGTGPLGALRPVWLTPLLFLAGVTWAVLLLIPGWLAHPRAPERGRVADVYRSVAAELRSAGTGAFGPARQAVTGALNAAYDELLTDRSVFGGHSAHLTWLAALLNQASLLSEACIALAQTGQRADPDLAGAIEAVADSIQYGTSPPRLPGRRPGGSAAERACWDRLAGAVRLAGGGRAPRQAPGHPGPPRPRVRGRVGGRLQQIRQGRLVWQFTIRLMLCIGAAAVCSEVLPLQRSYWVVLTVAIVLKPDFGSVFARALQRGIGTIVGAVAGALILAAVPGGPLLLLPLAVLAALLPLGRSRNYGLLSAFLTPLVVLLIDLLTKTGWQLAEVRLYDTLLGCLIALLIGYAPWPMSWHAHLPRQLDSAIDQVPGTPSGHWRPTRAARRTGQAAQAGLPGAVRPADRVPAHDVRAPVHQPPRHRLVARRRRARAADGRRDRHGGGHRRRHAAPGRPGGGASPGAAGAPCPARAAAAQLLRPAGRRPAGTGF